MKKRTKKLSFTRETIRSLDSGTLGKAAGGTDTSDFCIAPTGCECGSGDCSDSHFAHTCGTVCDIPSWHCTRCSIC